ncbi:hypothetical protein [Halocatena marina]|uniref:hypothetical protein n=1 Tax=Halocatena marina TaxID=2934937 RepID=UPI0036F370C7
MSFESLNVEFVFKDDPTADDVRRFLNRCLGLGCQTHQEGGTETVFYSEEVNDSNSAWTPTAEVFDALSTGIGTLPSGTKIWPSTSREPPIRLSRRESNDYSVD